MDASTRFAVLPQAREYGIRCFPPCLSPCPGTNLHGNAFIDWANRNSSAINSALDVHGAILFRGFGGLDPQYFSQFVGALGAGTFPYSLGNAVRTLIVGGKNEVFTANESPPDRPIPFHHELAQTPSYPRRVLFFCEREAETGGETPILDSTCLYEDLANAFPSFMNNLETHGVQYRRLMTPHDRPESAIGRGWRNTFGAETRAEVESALSSRGYSWEWRDPAAVHRVASDADESALLLEMSPRLDAVKAVGTDGKKKAFFNQLLAVWHGWKDEFNSPEDCVRFANGALLDKKAMDEILSVGGLVAKHTVAIPWQAGMLIDGHRNSMNATLGNRG